MICRPLPQRFEFDHHYPKSENNSVAVVLYGKIGSESFWSFHQQLEHLAKEGNVHYILRHYLLVLMSSFYISHLTHKFHIKKIHISLASICCGSNFCFGLKFFRAVGFIRTCSLKPLLIWPELKFVESLSFY